MWYIYVLRSLKDNKLYIGMSENPNKRLQEHNSGETKSTKGRRPFVLLYKEECSDRFTARLREKFYKSGKGREILKTIIPG